MTIKISSAKLNKSNRKFYKNNRILRAKYSPKWIAYKIHEHQVSKSIKRNHPPPNYTREGLHQWMVLQVGFEILYLDWIANNFIKWFKPSCDRLDDYKPYTLDNIRVVTWKVNFDKAHLDRKNGINNKNSKAVIGTHLKTKNIVEFYSAKQAQRELGIHQRDISKCCTKKYGRLSAGGYSWNFKN